MKKKIKIIDLLCYISIGDYDKLPKTIEYQGTEYIFDEDDYKIYKGANLLDDACLTRYIISSMLNDEVEILDEEDEFEELNKSDYQYSQCPTFKDKDGIITIMNNNFELHQKAIRDIIDNQKKIIERLNNRDNN
jgi:hypothetical protein